MKAKIDKFRDTFSTKLARGGIGSVLIKVSNLGTGLLLAVVLARVLGAREYGIYAFVYAAVTLASIPVQFGLPSLVVRETAKEESLGRWGAVRGLWKWSNWVIGLSSVVVLGVGVLVALYFRTNLSSAKLATFVWGGALIPLIGFGALRGASLRGLGKVVLGLMPDRVIRPLVLIVLVAIAYLVFGYHLTAKSAMALHVFAAGFAFLVGIWLLRRDNSYCKVAEYQPTSTPKAWLWSAVPLGLVAAVTQINTKIDVVMLGMYVDSADVGIYRVASLGATVVALGYNALGMVTMPYFSKLHTQKKNAELQKLATTVARMGAFAGIPILLVFILFGREILSLLFGEKYEAGYMVFVALSVIQFLNLCFGKLGTLLNMCGQEKQTLIVMTISAGVNILMNALMIPLFGMIGAAIATGLSYIIWKSLLWWVVRRSLGMDGSVLGLSVARRTT